MSGDEALYGVICAKLNHSGEATMHLSLRLHEEAER